MRLRIRHIATRFALLLAAAAVVPLLAYGFISVVSLQRGTRTTVIAGNLAVGHNAEQLVGALLVEFQRRERQLSLIT